MMYKKIWFFGDSYTQMLFLNDPQYIEWKKYQPKSWMELISSYLNCDNIEIIAHGGLSNQDILMNVYENMSRMDTGDVCFIGGTTPIRTVGYNHFRDKITTYNNDVIAQYLNQSDFSINRNIKKKLADVNSYYHSLPVKEEDIKVLMDYVSIFINQHHDTWNNYWIKQFTHQISNLEKIGVSSYFWSYDLWEEFTNYVKETNGKFNDEHWSGDGNREFYEYLVWCIKNNKRIITDYEHS